jgi:hypothetical protein
MTKFSGINNLFVGVNSCVEPVVISSGYSLLLKGSESWSGKEGVSAYVLEDGLRRSFWWGCYRDGLFTGRRAPRGRTVAFWTRRMSLLSVVSSRAGPRISTCGLVMGGK